eukprot:2376422-Rhodomonas_salina.1
MAHCLPLRLGIMLVIMMMTGSASSTGEGEPPEQAVKKAWCGRPPGAKDKGQRVRRVKGAQEEQQPAHSDGAAQGEP